MKKLAYLAFLLAVLGLIITGCEKMHSPVGPPGTEGSGSLLLGGEGGYCDTVDLIAGQHINVGTVIVCNDAGKLYVTYTTTGDWYMTETHLHVATSLSGIPQTKKNNPIPGQFDYKEDHDPTVTDYTYEIDLDWDPCTDLYIAAHAVVCKDGEEETAWGDGLDFLGKNWATYFTYQVRLWPKLPDGSVTMQVWRTGNTYFTFLLSGVPGGYDVENGYYYGWCVDSYVYINPGQIYHPTLLSSYDPNLPDYAQDDDWDMVNYILNNIVTGATMQDVQDAIWYFIDGVVYSSLDPKAKAMVDDALAKGEGFYPGSGDDIAVVCLLGPQVQLTFFGLTLWCP